MKMTWPFYLPGLLLIAACVTRVEVVPVEIEGAEPLSQPCASDSPPLSDEEIAALVQAMPSAEQREREFWAPRALADRACKLYERSRADSALAIIGRNNQLAREQR